MLPPDALTLETLAHAFSDVGIVVLADDGAIVQMFGPVMAAGALGPGATVGARVHDLPGEAGAH